MADSLVCSRHADEVQSEMLGGFVPLAERKARQHILFTGLWMPFQLASPAFGIKRLVNSIAPPVTSNLVEHSAAAIHLTFDINPARLFFDEQTDGRGVLSPSFWLGPSGLEYVRVCQYLEVNLEETRGKVVKWLFLCSAC